MQPQPQSPHGQSSAAKTVPGRVGLGLGKTRYIEVRYLSVQQAVRRRRIEIKKVRDGRNPANFLTKPRSLPDVRELLRPVKVILGETLRLRQGTPQPRWRGGVNHSPHYA